MVYAGAYEEIITPVNSQFLFGYPHVKRYSEGVHDHLRSSALYVESDGTQLLFIANDIIFITKDMASRIRIEVERRTGISGANIMISATHTHSGPITVDYASGSKDPVVPKADQAYIDYIVDKMAKAGIQARANAQAAVLGFSRADSTGIGTNRRDPAGPADHEVPLLVAMDVERKRYLACMMVVSMHPTVLHEDSRLISGDFPGLAREYLRDHVLGSECVVLHHSGPCGNQSPRHVVTGQNFAEARRLGAILGKAVEQSLERLEFRTEIDLESRRLFVEDAVRRSFSDLGAAREKLQEVQALYKRLKGAKTPSAQVRTVECDIFGAEEMVTLSSMATSGELEQYYRSCLPFEIQALRVGPWWYVGWSGELFVDFALDVKRKRGDTFVVSLANGENQGYITTHEASLEGGYEASNALFAPETGDMLVQRTLELLA